MEDEAGHPTTSRARRGCCQITAGLLGEARGDMRPKSSMGIWRGSRWMWRRWGDAGDFVQVETNDGGVGDAKDRDRAEQGPEVAVELDEEDLLCVREPGLIRSLAVTPVKCRQSPTCIDKRE
jgi:hypothetical protein